MVPHELYCTHVNVVTDRHDHDGALHISTDNTDKSDKSRVSGQSTFLTICT